MESYIAAGDIHLASDDVRAIDNAGYKATEMERRRVTLRRGARWASAAGLLVLAVYHLAYW
jgi:hypothetical protein